MATDITSQQTALLRSLLSPARIRRLLDAEVLLGDKAYTALDLMTDVQDGVWSEVGTEKVKIDPLRRNLQRTYLENMKAELAPKPEAPQGQGVPFPIQGGGETGSGDFKAIARDVLTTLKSKIDAAVPKAADAITRVHLQEASHEIDAMLTDKK